MSNPFQEESKDLITLDTKAIAHPSTAELVTSDYEKGEATFRDFLNGLSDEPTFYKPFKKNKIGFFCQEAGTDADDMKKQVLKDDRRLFSQTYLVSHVNVISLSS